MNQTNKQRSFTTLQEIGYENLLLRLGNRTSKRESVHSQRVNSKVFTLSEDGISGDYLSHLLFQDSIHFDLTFTPLPHLGSKWMTAGSARLLAKGTLPRQVLLSLSVPNKISVEMMEEILSGMDSHPVDADVQVMEVGPSREFLTASIIQISTKRDADLLLSDGVKDGDFLCVTGDIGSSMAGLRVLLREKRFWAQKHEETFTPSLGGYETVVGKQLLPTLRTDLLTGLKQSEVKVGVMVSLESGLMNDLQSVAHNLECGFELFTPALPIHLETRKVADEMKEDVDRYALYGGEDYELLFTLAEHEVEKLRADFEDFSVIGRVTDKKNEIVVHDGEGE